METIAYTVPAMSCEHCEKALRDEISDVAGVDSVEIELATKRVEVRGAALDDGAIRAAIEEAGYEAT